jgi:hypothetical protein
MIGWIVSYDEGMEALSGSLCTPGQLPLLAGRSPVSKRVVSVSAGAPT